MIHQIHRDGDYFNKIKDAIYEIYKVYWLRTHIKDLDYRKLYLEYLNSLDCDKVTEGIYVLDSISYSYTFEDYIFQVGYDGGSYVCFDEFLDNEYQNTEIIKECIYSSFKDENTANAVYLCYLNDISYDKTGKTTFMDIAIEKMNKSSFVTFELNNKKCVEMDIPNALSYIIANKK